MRPHDCLLDCDCTMVRADACADPRHASLLCQVSACAALCSKHIFFLRSRSASRRCARRWRHSTGANPMCLSARRTGTASSWWSTATPSAAGTLLEAVAASGLVHNMRDSRSAATPSAAGMLLQAVAAPGWVHTCEILGRRQLLQQQACSCKLSQRLGWSTYAGF